MSQIDIYEYHVTGSGPYGVPYKPATDVVVGTETLSRNDEFVVSGKLFQYLGGADVGGVEVGFFALGPNGKVHFFATTAITGPLTDVTLNAGQSFDTACFMAGTYVATPTAEVAIEELAVGDVVLTDEGVAAPVKWVGRRTVSTLFADPNRVMPIRIKAGALAPDLPARDLLVSPCHALLVDGVLVQAGALVNGTSIVRETDVPATFVYYHVELENHSLILTEGVAAETFIDNVDRMAFDNWDEHERLYPEGQPIRELSYPRAASARQVPASIVRRLQARADLMAAGALQAA